MALLPQNITTNVTLKNQQTVNKTYKLDFTNKKITNYIDGIKAVSQSVTKILNTERYKHLIYNWDYGNELNNLIGKDKEYIKSEQQRIIKEALMVDNRILDVANFIFTENMQNNIHISFTVVSTEGDLKMEVCANV